jgi:Zn-dependent protease
MFATEHPSLQEWLITMLVLVISITIHEFAHAITADRLGDPTPRSQGRISINPVDHLDPVGTIMMALCTYFGYGIGWGRPVQYNPALLRRPRWDPLIIAAAGPISNVVQALVFAGAFRLAMAHGWMELGSGAFEFVNAGILVNVLLTLFNLIPIPPLDGSKVLSAILPIELATAYDRVMMRWSMLLFLVLIVSGVVGPLLAGPLDYFYRILAG